MSSIKLEVYSGKPSYYMRSWLRKRERGLCCEMLVVEARKLVVFVILENDSFDLLRYIQHWVLVFLSKHVLFLFVQRMCFYLCISILKEKKTKRIVWLNWLKMMINTEIHN